MGSGCCSGSANTCFTPVSAQNILAQYSNKIFSNQAVQDHIGHSDISDNALCQAIYSNNKKQTYLRKSSSNKQIKDYAHKILGYRPNASNSVYQKNDNFIYQEQGETTQHFHKRRLIEVNKNFVCSSIQTSKCVHQTLNFLASMQILKESQYHNTQKLKAKNLKGIMTKQNRLINLTAKHKKMESFNKNKIIYDEIKEPQNKKGQKNFRGRRLVHKKALTNQQNRNFDSLY